MEKDRLLKNKKEYEKHQQKIEENGKQAHQEKKVVLMKKKVISQIVLKLIHKETLAIILDIDSQ